MARSRSELCDAIGNWWPSFTNRCAIIAAAKACFIWYCHATRWTTRFIAECWVVQTNVKGTVPFLLIQKSGQSPKEQPRHELRASLGSPAVAAAPAACRALLAAAGRAARDRRHEPLLAKGAGRGTAPRSMAGAGECPRRLPCSADRYFACLGRGRARDTAQRIVLILDNSATMRASDVQPSRLEQAKSEARRMIASLHWCDEMAVVATSPEPREIQTLTGNKALLRDRG